MSTTITNATVRIATVEDAEAIQAIYAPYVKNTAITFEVTVPSVDEFRHRIETTLVRYPYIVAELDGEIVGYAYAGGFKARVSYRWSVETSIYVRMDMRRSGIGRMLYDELERWLKRCNIINVNACIASPRVEDRYLTKDSISFHERLGYSLVGEFNSCAYKFDTWYNMVWMEKFIGEHMAVPAEVISFSELIKGDKL